MPGYHKYTRFVIRGIKKYCRKCYSLPFTVFLFCCVPCLAQRAKIDSLKITLRSLNDSGEVDCLNVLSLAYTYLNADTAKAFSQEAFTKASAINYLSGKISSINNRARIEGHALRNFIQQEKLSRQALQLYQPAAGEKVLAEAYMNLALAFFYQNAFDSSVAVCKTVMEFSKKTGDQKTTGEALGLMGSISLETGNYDDAFDYFNESLAIFKSITDNYNASILLARIGDLYRLAGDQKTALNFYFQSLGYPKGPTLVWHPLADLGDTYYSLQPFDAAGYEQEKYAQTIKSLTVRSNYLSNSAIPIAEMHIANKEYDTAIVLLAGELKTANIENDRNKMMRLLLDLGRAHEGKNNYKKAFAYTSALVREAKSQHAKQYLRDGYRLTYLLYDHLHKFDSAYAYHLQYTSMKDSVALDDFGKKLALFKAAKENEKKQAQIELLNNENLINEQKLQLSEQQLASGSLQKNMLMVGVLLLLLFGFIVFRNIMLIQKNETNRHEIEKKALSLQKMESERTKQELQQQASELEMKALRSQMNPHFIFNSLNAINVFIMENNKVQASKYLTKFSRLVRLILQNSQAALISLESELDALKLYLDLEALRFNNRFVFAVFVDKELDTLMLKVPPLIIQPYAENAIWHGLMHKANTGHLQVDVYADGTQLCFKITDDGIGRKKATELKSKSASAHNSMGMQITANRIAMLKQEDSAGNQVKITDLVLADGSIGGTEVILNIPFLYD